MKKEKGKKGGEKGEEEQGQTSGSYCFLLVFGPRVGLRRGHGKEREREKREESPAISSWLDAWN